MVWEPAPIVFVVSCAFPPFKTTGPPKAALSTKNWTFPVGVTVAGAFGFTVAVNVTLSPKTVGLFDVVRVVVVFRWVTVTDSLGSLQTVATALLLASPL
jgi:hypothetical protein